MWRASPSGFTLHNAAERFRERNLRIGPVQQQEIDFAQAQPHQAVVRRTFQRPRCEMRRPDFRGHEQFVALDAGSAHAVADVALIVVHFRGVDVAVAKPQGLFDDARAGAPAQFPGAEPDQRDFGAVGLDAWDWFDRCHAVNCSRDCDRNPGDNLRRGKPRIARGAIRATTYRALPSTAKAASGASSMTLKSARAGPRGERLPCSQLRRVSTGTPIRAAKAAWVRPVRVRMLRAYVRVIATIRGARRIMRRRGDRLRVRRDGALAAVGQHLDQTSVRF